MFRPHQRKSLRRNTRSKFSGACPLLQTSKVGCVVKSYSQRLTPQWLRRNGTHTVKAPEHVTTTTTLAPVKEIITTPTPTKKAPALITKNEAGPQHAHINHFHVNQVDFQEERAERSRQTVGAVWALTLGISHLAFTVATVLSAVSPFRNIRHSRVGAFGRLPSAVAEVTSSPGTWRSRSRCRLSSQWNVLVKWEKCRT